VPLAGLGRRGPPSRAGSSRARAALPPPRLPARGEVRRPAPRQDHRRPRPAPAETRGVALGGGQPAPERAGGQSPSRAVPPGLGRPLRCGGRQLRRPLGERGEREGRPRQDRAAEIAARGIDEVHGHRRARADEEGRREALGPGRRRIAEPVRAERPPIGQGAGEGQGGLAAQLPAAGAPRGEPGEEPGRRRRVCAGEGGAAAGRGQGRGQRLRPGRPVGGPQAAPSAAGTEKRPRPRPSSQRSPFRRLLPRSRQSRAATVLPSRGTA